MNELRQQSCGFLRRDDVGYLAAQFIERDSNLPTGQVGAETEMGTAAEGRMARVRAFDVEAVWIGVASTPPLVDLQAAVERAVVRTGFAPEEKRFRPHITLARLKDTPAPRLQSFVAGHNLFKESVAIEEFTLFSSKLGAGDPVYVPEAAYPLTPT